MNIQTNTTARRTNIVRSVAMAGAGLVIGLVGGLGFSSIERLVGLNEVVTSGIVVAAVAGVVAVSNKRWWREIGEAKREQHKRAWWWGGSVGLAVGCALVLIALSRGLASIPEALVGPTPADTILRVMFGIVFCQVAGYAAFWTGAELSAKARSAA